MDIKVCTFNVNGLGEYRKRRQVFEFLKHNKYGICFLQELHCKNNTTDTWEREWGGKAFFSGNSSNSTGIGILFNSDVTFTLLEYKEIISGRLQVLKINISEIDIVLINIYGPNKDDLNFFNTVETVIKQYENETLIIGGDFNSILDQDKDKRNGRKETNKQNREKINRLINEYELNDIWRVFNNDTEHFTWHSNHKPPIFCRLDYFLTSSNIINKTSKCNITTGIRSDHSLVYFIFNPYTEPRGPGYFKLNNSILFDAKYQKIIKDTIKDITEINSEANANTKWEILKGSIRNETIKYTTKLKKESNKEENELKQKINNLETKLSNEPHNTDTDDTLNY